MKKMSMLLSLLFILILSSCVTKEKDDGTKSFLDSYKVINTNSEVRKGDFVYRLVSEKKEFKPDEQVKIYVELEYVGDQEKIDIYHAASPFYFHLKEKTRHYNITYVMNEPLIKTTLYKGKTLKEYYPVGVGAYSESDANKDYIKFIQTIMEKKRLPFGYYIMNGTADFHIATVQNGMELERNYTLNAQIDFKVKEE